MGELFANRKRWTNLVSCRTVLSLLVFWGQIQNYMMRVNLNLIIVAMVKSDMDTAGNTGQTDDGQINSESCVSDLDTSNPEESVSSLENGGTLEWDMFTRGLVLSSFSWGYITSQIIGGRLSEMYGFKTVYGLGLVIPALLCLVHPVAAKTSYWAFIAVRVVLGIAEGVTWPCMHCMTAKWVPAEERSSFISQSYFGSTFGLMITFPMCGLIIDKLGWEACFYIIAGITLCWAAFWWALIHDNPQQHPRISEEELELLSTIKVSSHKKVPWKEMITSPPVWGTLITDCANSWGIISFSSMGPTFIKTMLGLDIKTNGFMSGLPMLSRYFGGVLLARLSDWFIKSKRLKILTSRKLFNSISQITPAITMVIMVYIGCNPVAVTALQMFGLFVNGAIASGHFASGVDLTPNFAGTLFGITNTLSGGCMGMLAPLICGALLEGKEKTWAGWRLLFWVAAGVYIIGNGFYVWLVKADPQPWNEIEEDSKKASDEEDAAER